jgi:hypothetical protein
MLDVLFIKQEPAGSQFGPLQKPLGAEMIEKFDSALSISYY